MIGVSTSALKLISLVAQVVLTMLFVGGYLWVLRQFMVGAVTVVPELLELFKTLLSVLTGSLITILNFWFVSSRSSQQKDEQRG